MARGIHRIHRRSSCRQRDWFADAWTEGWGFESVLTGDKEAVAQVVHAVAEEDTATVGSSYRAVTEWFQSGYITLTSCRGVDPSKPGVSAVARARSSGILRGEAEGVGPGFRAAAAHPI